MIILDYQDRRPIYEQVAEKIRILILNEILKPGEQMPSVRQLAMELAVNPNTIQRAYMELEQQGYIYPVKGKGNYISDTEELKRTTRNGYYQELKSLIESGIQIGAEEEEVIRIVRNCYKEAGK